jgi:hypothetical protein
MEGKNSMTIRYNVGVPEKEPRVENHTPVIPKKFYCRRENLVNSPCGPGLMLRLVWARNLITIPSIQANPPKDGNAKPRSLPLVS